MTITTLLSGLPARSMTQTVFDAATAQLMLDLPTWGAEVNAMGANVDAKNTLVIANAAAAAASEAAAATSAAIANGHATAAAAGAGTALWVSGTTYVAVSDVRVSPADFRSYRRKTNGAGTTDPSADPTNWQLISYGTLPMLKVSEQYASGTEGVSLTSADITSTRVLNTVDINTVAGSSLASDTVTLPPGTYDVSARVGFWSTHDARAFLYNTSDAAYVLDGSNCRSLVSGNTSDSFIVGRFTIAASKNFKIRYFVDSGGGGRGGQATACGRPELYCEATFIKVA